MMSKSEFENAVYPLPKPIAPLLSSLPESIKERALEIRLREGAPLCVCCDTGSVFVGKNAVISRIDPSVGYEVTAKDVSSCASAVSGYCLYAREEDISSGFVTYSGGHRVGFSGVFSSGRLIRVTGLNIRIARDIPFAARDILASIRLSGVRGVIVAGAPCSGKTTVLKSMARLLSSQSDYGFMKTAVIDERGEMSTLRGSGIDVLSGVGKSEGITHAVRTLSPQVVICDEIISEEEAKSVLSCLDSGIRAVVSVHCADKDELYRRSVSKLLLQSGFFDCAVILRSVGEKAQTVDLREEKHGFESCGGPADIIYGGFEHSRKRKGAL